MNKIGKIAKYLATYPDRNDVQQLAYGFDVTYEWFKEHAGSICDVLIKVFDASNATIEYDYDDEAERCFEVFEITWRTPKLYKYTIYYGEPAPICENVEEGLVVAFCEEHALGKLGEPDNVELELVERGCYVLPN